MKSRALFGDTDHPTCRRFLECVALAEEVSDVQIRGTEAELEFAPENRTPCNRSSTGSPRSSPVESPPSNGHANGSTNGHANGTNGHANGSNGHANGTNGHANGTSYVAHPPTGNGSTVAGEPVRASRSERLRLDSGRSYRRDRVVTGWLVKRESPGLLKLKNTVLYRKAELCQAIERELMNVLGSTCTRPARADLDGQGRV